MLLFKFIFRLHSFDLYSNYNKTWSVIILALFIKLDLEYLNDPKMPGLCETWFFFCIFMCNKVEIQLDQHKSTIDGPDSLI